MPFGDVRPNRVVALSYPEFKGALAFGFLPGQGGSTRLSALNDAMAAADEDGHGWYALSCPHQRRSSAPANRDQSVPAAKML